MLKILVYACMEGKYSSREIERACTRDMNYIWLLNGEKVPDYHEIARFRRDRLSVCAEDLFYRLVKQLRFMDEIKYEHLFVDGTKIEANADKYSFVWKKSVTKYEKRLLEAPEKRTAELSWTYGKAISSPEGMLTELETESGDNFVYGRGKRKTQLQRDVEDLRSLLSRKAKYAGYQETFGERNSFSKTDPDATFMHMKEDHMRNSQLKPGYNVQFAVEGEYVTGVSVSSERSDQLTLTDTLETMHDKLGEYYADVTADAGCESEVTYYECENCEDCPYRKKCTKAKGNRKLQISKRFVRQRAAPLERITSEKGKEPRVNRSIQSEGAFGVVKQNYSFRQFLLRGKKKIFAEILLVAMAYNVNKLHAKIQQGRTKTQLFKKLSA